MKPSNKNLLDDFLKTLELYETAPLTILRKRNVISNFLEWLDSQGKHFFDVTKFDIEDWLAKEKSNLKVNSKVQITNALKSFYGYLIERKHVTENPVTEIAQRMNRADKKKIMRPILSVQDVIRIIKASTNPRDRAMMLTFYKTGMRVHELLQLNLDSIYWNERRIRIPKRKGGSPGDVYFDDECERALKLWVSVRSANGDNALFTNIKGIRLERRYVTRMVKSNAIKSGVGKDSTDSSEAITPHVFRYAFTTHLAGNRCHPKVIQMLRGDADASMLDRYTQFTPEQVRQEYLRAIPKLGI
jgi:site-specific recombinase XerD